MPELNREDIIKALECCSKHPMRCAKCPYQGVSCCTNEHRKDALTLIKQLAEENESLGIENEVQRLNLGNTRDDLNNAECDVARLKRENTALEREVERLKADAVPRREVERLLDDFQRTIRADAKVGMSAGEILMHINNMLIELRKKYIGE